MKTIEVLDKVMKGKRIKDSTKRTYSQALESLAKYSEDFPVSGVIIDEWIAQLEGLADITVALYYDKVRAAAKYMSKAYKIPNPTDETDRPKVMKKPRRHHEPKVIMQIIAACRFGYDRELVLTFIDSGCRSIDLANLKGKNVFEGYFEVAGKTGISKYRLDTRLCVALKNLAGDAENYVFTGGVSRYGEGYKVSPGALSMRIRRICQRAGLTGEKLGSHTLRHSVGSVIADETLSPLAVKSILQQTKIDTAMVYIHDAEEKISQRMSPLALMAEKANGTQQQVGIEPKQIGMNEVDIDNLKGTELAVIKSGKIQAEDDYYYADMFPEIVEGMEVRPQLKEDDLMLMRRAFISYARTEENPSDTVKARALMKRITRKAHK